MPVDRELTFSFHHILYFWFAFVAANPVWIIVPVLVIVSACKNLSKTAAAAVGKPKKA